MTNLRNFRNFLYFYRRRVFFNSVIFAGYSKVCYDAQTWENETLRMGVAGSMAQGTVEALFHFVDTVNIKSKAASAEANTSTLTMVRKIFAAEGVVGFGRGIGAAVYGNYSAGFIYFVFYKWLKNNMPELRGGCKQLIAGFVAEATAIMFKFPFDLVKCRLQSVNYIFKYSSWSHGIAKEYKTNGIPGLYNGVFPYLLTYCSFTALQFSIYEHLLKSAKN